MTPKEVLALIREKEVKAVDLRFMDFPGTWKHFTVPADSFEENVFEDGLGFDGSSIHGWKAINESDMLVVPVADTAFLDPFCREVTLALICNIQDPLTKEDFSRDPRNVARKAVNFLKYKGFADTANFGPSLEFFVFDDVKFDQTSHSAFYYVDSNEAAWNSGRDEKPNLGNKIPYRRGYFPCPPVDQLADLRSEMMRAMLDCGLTVETQHHEVATAGQAEIDLRFQECVLMADQMMTYKYIVKNVAKKYNKTVTFMPKPLFGDNGSGRIWAMAYNGFSPPTLTNLCQFPGTSWTGLSSFGLDRNNEIYLCKMGSAGRVYRLTKAGVGSFPMPALLSQTGVFTNMNTMAAAPGLIPFGVNTPLWSDRAEKLRWIALPNNGAPYGPGEQIAFSETGEWDFPDGTVFVKHFDLPTDDTNPSLRKRLETRLLVRNTDGAVYGFT